MFLQARSAIYSLLFLSRRDYPPETALWTDLSRLYTLPEVLESTFRLQLVLRDPQ